MLVGKEVNGGGKRLSGKLKFSVNKCQAVSPGEDLIAACHNATYLTPQRLLKPVTRPFIYLSLSFSLIPHSIIRTLLHFPHFLAALPCCLSMSCERFLRLFKSFLFNLPLFSQGCHHFCLTKLPCNDRGEACRIFCSEINHSCRIPSKGVS